MQTQVYAVQTAIGWSWRMSICLEVDKAVWGEGGERSRVLRANRSFSFGQAQQLAERLNKAGAEALDENRLAERAEAEWKRLLMQTSGSRSADLHKPGQPARERESGRKELIPEAGLGKVWVWEEWGRVSDTSGRKIGVQVKEEEYVSLVRELQGRCLLAEELTALAGHLGLVHAAEHWRTYVQLGYLQGELELLNGFEEEERKLWWRWLERLQPSSAWRCRRCGSGEASQRRTQCPACGGLCAYCEGCLTMGRVRFCSMLIGGRASEGDSGKAYPQPRQHPVLARQRHHHRLSGQEQRQRQLPDSASGVAHPAAEPCLAKWGLAPAQTAAVMEGLRYMREPAGEASRFLLWAVTGAGKTEMIYPLIEEELARGGQVLVAAPRKDVVLELKPRLAKAFPDAPAVCLYGGSEERWGRGDITLSTTHQLLRFRHAFDLVILDEIDAFPYHGNPMLEHAARQACRPGGRFIFLSATPPEPLRREARRGRCPHAIVPARYHGHPLPVPALGRVKPIRSMLQEGVLDRRVHKQARRSLERGAQLFVFVPRIRHTEGVAQLLRRELELAPELIQGTSSQDPERDGKVGAFRRGEIRILVTTTILERGVTVPRTDVMVLDADAPLFDEASLVQMAGRAGRSAEDPAGLVLYAAPSLTRAQAKARKQIIGLNRQARQRGFLRHADARLD